MTAGAAGFFILSQSRERPRTVGRVLPLRHDTFELENRRTPIIFITAFPDPRIQERALARGCLLSHEAF
jgi:CheY-like chemotaxis protein